MTGGKVFGRFAAAGGVAHGCQKLVVGVDNILRQGGVAGGRSVKG